MIGLSYRVESELYLNIRETTYPGVYVGAEATVAEGTTINPNVVIMRFMKTEAFSEIAPGLVV